MCAENAQCDNQKTFSQMKIEERKAEEVKLFLTGEVKTKTEMAQVLNVHRNTIIKDFRDIKLRMEGFVETTIDDVAKKAYDDFNDVRNLMRGWLELPDTEENFPRKRFASELLSRLSLDFIDSIKKLRTGIEIEENEDVYAEMLEHVRRIKREVRGGVQEGAVQ